MLRLVFLSLAGAVTFAGFCIPLILSGAAGLVVCVITIAIGATAFWVAETKTRGSLDDDTKFNRLMKADGENLVEPGKPDDPR